MNIAVMSKAQKHCVSFAPFIVKQYIINTCLVQMPFLAVSALDNLYVCPVFGLKCSSEDEDHKCVSYFSLPDGTRLYSVVKSVYITLYLF